MHQDDRRAFLRVVAEFPVGWSRIGEDGQTQLPQHQASTVNVSAGGVKMVSAEPVAVGDRLRIEVRFSRPPLIVFTDASVIRVDSIRQGRCESGLRFDPLDTYIEQRVVRWVYAEDRRMAERRAAVRVPLQIMVTCHTLSAAGEVAGTFRARTIDLAADGARIATDSPLASGDRLRLDLELGDPPQSIHLEGAVMWGQTIPHEHWAYGIRFEGLGRLAQRALVERALEEEQRRRHTGD